MRPGSDPGGRMARARAGVGHGIRPSETRWRGYPKYPSKQALRCQKLAGKLEAASRHYEWSRGQKAALAHMACSSFSSGQSIHQTPPPDQSLWRRSRLRRRGDEGWIGLRSYSGQYTEKSMGHPVIRKGRWRRKCMESKDGGDSGNNWSPFTCEKSRPAPFCLPREAACPTLEYVVGVESIGCSLIAGEWNPG